MGTLLAFDFEFPDWAGELRKKTPDIKKKAMATVQTNRGLLFKKEGAHNNHPRWKELASGKSQEVDEDSGEKARQILQDKGTLRKSIAPDGANPDLPKAGPDGILKFNGDEMEIGTNVKYAAIHNYGGVIEHPGTKKGFGAGIVIPPHNIKMPKRPFLEGAWNSTDQDELDETITNYCARLLDRIDA